MKTLKSLTRILSSLMSIVSVLVLGTPAYAAITNPGVPAALGGDAEAAASGSIFASYLVTIWRGVIFAGGLLVLVFFIWGGVEWISAGGDSAKVGKARDKIIQAIVGLIVLVASFALIGLLSQLFFGPEFNLLNLTIPTPGGSSGQPPVIGTPSP